MSEGELPMTGVDSPDRRSDLSPARDEFPVAYNKRPRWEQSERETDGGAARRPAAPYQYKPAPEPATTYPRSRALSQPAHGIERPPNGATGGGFQNGNTNQSVSKHHFYALCGLRNSMVRDYEALVAIVNDLRQNKTVSERAIDEVSRNMADKLCCIQCGAYFPRVDSSIFVLKCGHIICKSGCFDRIGARCPVCPPPQPFRNNGGGAQQP